MLISEVLPDRWTLSFDGRTVLEHRHDAPFATAIRRKKTYEAKRGTVKTTVVETARIPLTDAEETETGVKLSAGGHTLSIDLSEQPNGVQLTFAHEEGWAYAFCLPAIEGEAVFGGGEQYRKTNLRGETVVNFVSEHINAKTVIEKALLPQALYREKPHSAIGSYAPMPVFQTDRGRRAGCSNASAAVPKVLDKVTSFTITN